MDKIFPEKINNYFELIRLNKPIGFMLLLWPCWFSLAYLESPEEYLLKLRLTRPSSSIKGLLTSINLTPISPIDARVHTLIELIGNLIIFGEVDHINLKILASGILRTFLQGKVQLHF